MDKNLLELVLYLNSLSSTIPLEDDHEKLQDVKELCSSVNINTKQDLKNWFNDISDLDILDTQSSTWKVVKSLIYFEN